MFYHVNLFTSTTITSLEERSMTAEGCIEEGDVEGAMEGTVDGAVEVDGDVPYKLNKIYKPMAVLDKLKPLIVIAMG